MGQKVSLQQSASFLDKAEVVQVVRLARAAASSARDANFSDWSDEEDTDNAAAFVFLGWTRLLNDVGRVE